jgi:dolichol-phosphate mannosyltransferase
VIGASGFIGSHIYSTLLANDIHVIGTRCSSSDWRLAELLGGTLIPLDLRSTTDLRDLLQVERPTLVVNCGAYGNTHLETDVLRMASVNFTAVLHLARWCASSGATLVQLGSSSEYGTNAAGPQETAIPEPNSSYGLSKLAATQALMKLHEDAPLRGAVLRIYSAYGPLENASRLIPTLVREGILGRLPVFAPADVSHDFIHVSDVIRAVIGAVEWASGSSAFDLFNIGTGMQTSLSQVAEMARRVFDIKAMPIHGADLRPWDLTDWFADPRKAERTFGWKAQVSLEEGIRGTADWYRKEGRAERLLVSSRSRQIVTFVVAIFRDGPAINEMYQRIQQTSQLAGCEYEIIFVIDASPDNAERLVLDISSRDPRVLGVCHSRNFGSQAAFISGLTRATGAAAVLMDGDLQDPPEVAGEMIDAWLRGSNVVLARRVSRDAPPLLNVGYRLFYRVLERLSSFSVPRDVGDFSLMSRAIYLQLLAMTEREPFVRVMRAYLGHDPEYVEYHRPHRKYGVTTNSLSRNVKWAVGGIIAASRKPLSAFGVFSLIIVTASGVALIAQVVIRLVSPSSTPSGLTTIILLLCFFGAMNLLSTAVVGEYVGRGLEQVRGRPRYVVAKIIRDGQVIDKIEDNDSRMTS